jgi:outer membrane lipoprotein-sorting protein
MLRRQHQRQRALAVGLACLFLLAGCTTVQNGSVTDPDAVGDHVQTRYDSIDRYEATVTKTVTGPAQTTTVRASLTVETDEYTRIEYQTGPRAGTVTTIDTSSARSGQPTLSTGARAAMDGAVPTYGALASELVATSNVTVERTTVLDGRQTAIVSFVPDNTTDDRTTDVRVERHVWIDTERQIPLQIETTWSMADGESVTETVRYTNVTVTEQSQTTADGAGMAEGGVTS